MKKNKISTICLTAIFTALVFVFTTYIRIPSHVGYTHLGDSMIYLSASLLPLPFAIFASVFGSTLSDCLSGYAIWAPATIIIKLIITLLFSVKSVKILSPKIILPLILSVFVTALGYYLYDAILIGNFVSAIAGIAGYIFQSIINSILFIFIGLTLDKINFKNRILK